MKEVPLTRGMVALVDDEDYERVAQHRWYALQGGRRDRDVPLWYAHRTAMIRPREMHRFILNAPDGVEVDHKDGDGLNNTRSNLRLASRIQNGRNHRLQQGSATGYKGVSKRANDTYRAYIYDKGRQVHLGNFTDSESAARAYDAAALKLFGEFARLNFPALTGDTSA